MKSATCEKCGQGLRLLREYQSLVRERGYTCSRAVLLYACAQCKYVVTYVETLPPDLDSWLATMRMYDWIGKLNVLDGVREEPEVEDCGCGASN